MPIFMTSLSCSFQYVNEYDVYNVAFTHTHKKQINLLYNFMSIKIHTLCHVPVVLWVIVMYSKWLSSHYQAIWIFSRALAVNPHSSSLNLHPSSLNVHSSSLNLHSFKSFHAQVSCGTSYYLCVWRIVSTQGTWYLPSGARLPNGHAESCYCYSRGRTDCTHTDKYPRVVSCVPCNSWYLKSFGCMWRNMAPAEKHAHQTNARIKTSQWDIKCLMKYEAEQKILGV